MYKYFFAIGSSNLILKGLLMSSWDVGNFDEDTAADFLSSFTDRLIQEIKEAVNNSDTSVLEPDEYDGVVLLCKIDILNLIAKQEWLGCSYPDISTIKKWKKIYLDVFDKYFSDTLTEDERV